jgi:hypothetical protein
MGLGAACLCGALACGTQMGPNPPAVAPRSFRMGFSAIPPRADSNLVLPVIDLWSRRADAAIISQEPPWADLLGGADPEALVDRDQVPLANYFRAKGHRLWVYLDPGNGLNRAGESDALVRAGRSIAEPAVQALFRRYAAALDTHVHPEHLGLALETNLIRDLSPPTLYAAIRRVANDAAVDVRARDPVVALSVSVQVDHAWGRAAGAFQGVPTDLADFPFVQELGLSSYPYLAGFAQPEQIPLEYYSRLTEGRMLPLMVTEGGWASASVASITSSPDEQRRYIARHLQILDAAGATAVFQLTFTDLDLVASPPPAGSILPLFASLGLVDVNLNPKPALAAWDAGFARPRR